jgi:hypothetical protein
MATDQPPPLLIRVAPDPDELRTADPDGSEARAHNVTTYETGPRVVELLGEGPPPFPAVDLA